MPLSTVTSTKTNKHTHTHINRLTAGDGTGSQWGGCAMLRGLVAGFGARPQSREFVHVCGCSSELYRVLVTTGGVEAVGPVSFLLTLISVIISAMLI